MIPLYNLQHQLRCKQKLKYAKLEENQMKLKSKFNQTRN